MSPTPPIDTSWFPTGVIYDDDELDDLAPLLAEGRDYVLTRNFGVPLAELVLGYGVFPIVAVYLARFARPIERGELEGETEQWVVVGDLPSMCFETEVARTPAEALQFYCILAEDWAYCALSGDVSECYPIPVEPNQKHVEMLMSRVRFLREKVVPIAVREPKRDLP
jgi:hypothetical protein